MIGLSQVRPPFVEFKQIAVHDPKRSEELGYRVTKDVDMAFIMQPGSRDQFQVVASDWLANIRRKHLDGSPDSYPIEWIDSFKKKYELWKEGVTAPLDGTSVKEWPILSPAQVENFIACNILTIEDVANMTEEALGRVGMGSRELKTKANEWIKGKEIAQTAIAENVELKKQLADLSARLAELEADKPKRGRPKLAEAA